MIGIPGMIWMVGIVCIFFECSLCSFFSKLHSKLHNSFPPFQPKIFMFLSIFISVFKLHSSFIVMNVKKTRFERNGV
jgi:hypothetical protein